MTPEQINVAIAEIRGWTFSKLKLADAWKPGAGVWNSPSGYIHSSVPNYCYNLNTMREALLTLDNGELWTWWLQLEEICGGSTEALIATAAQQAEAFLWTVGDREKLGSISRKGEGEG